MDSNEITLADRLRQLAEQAGSVSALARVCGISASTLNGYVMGKFEPRATELRKIASANGVSIDWLVSGDEQTDALDSALVTVRAEAVDADDWKAATAIAIAVCREAGVLSRVDPKKFAAMVWIIHEMEAETRTDELSDTVTDVHRKYRRLTQLL